MGKRKSSKPEPRRKKYVLPTEFDCPLCNFSRCVDVKIIKKQAKGLISCRLCSSGYEMMISPIMEKADIYCMWIDECERINQEKIILANKNKKLNENLIEENEQKFIADEEEDDLEIKENTTNLKKRKHSDVEFNDSENLINSRKIKEERKNRYKKKELMPRTKPFSSDEESEDSIIEKPVEKIKKVRSKNKLKKKKKKDIESDEISNINSDSDSLNSLNRDADDLSDDLESVRFKKKKQQMMSESDSDSDMNEAKRNDLEKDLLD
jgi:transcription elongation factor Elf1